VTDPARIAAFTIALSHAARAWRREVDAALVEFGLSDATAAALVHIDRLGDGARQGALAEFLGIEGPSLVRLLDHLCEAGLAERREVPGDRRARTIHLTAEGRDVVNRINRVVARLRKRVFGEVDAADFEAALRIFAALERGTGRSILLPEKVLA
jgi:MarR family transcriptional regulator, transcriptional regulator for hemolysin